MDLSALESVFPHVPKTAFKALVDKEVYILVGLNMNSLMPEGGSGIDKCNGVKVKRSEFGEGWVVGGVLDSDLLGDYTPHSFSSQAATIRVAKVSVMPETELNPDFWECDQLGVKIAPKCDRCRKCQESGKCSDSHIQHTAKEQAELDLIKANTRLVNGEMWVDYLFIRDPAILLNSTGCLKKRLH